MSGQCVKSWSRILDELDYVVIFVRLKASLQATAPSQPKIRQRSQGPFAISISGHNSVTSV